METVQLNNSVDINLVPHLEFLIKQLQIVSSWILQLYKFALQPEYIKEENWKIKYNGRLFNYSIILAPYQDPLLFERCNILQWQFIFISELIKIVNKD